MFLVLGSIFKVLRNAFTCPRIAWLLGALDIQSVELSQASLPAFACYRFYPLCSRKKKIFGLPRLSPHSYSASLLSAAMLPRLRTTSYRPVSEHLFLVALRTDSDSPLLSLGPCGLSRRVLARSDLSQSHDTLLVRRYRLRSVQPRLQCQGVPVKRVRRRRP